MGPFYDCVYVDFFLCFVSPHLLQLLKRMLQHRFCFETPEMFCGEKKQQGEWIMTEFSLLGALFLSVIYSCPLTLLVHTFHCFTGGSYEYNINRVMCNSRVVCQWENTSILPSCLVFVD